MTDCLSNLIVGICKTVRVLESWGCKPRYLQDVKLTYLIALNNQLSVSLFDQTQSTCTAPTSPSHWHKTSSAVSGTGFYSTPYLRLGKAVSDIAKHLVPALPVPQRLVTGC